MIYFYHCVSGHVDNSNARLPGEKASALSMEKRGIPGDY